MQNITTIGFSDRLRTYRYALSYVDNILYLLIPDYEPNKFDYNIDSLHVHVSYFEDNLEKTIIDKDLDIINDVLACTEIRDCDDFYNEYIEIGNIPGEYRSKNLYISLGVNDNTDFGTGQACLITKTKSMSWIPCVVNVDGSAHLSMDHFPLDNLKEIITGNIIYKIKIYVVDDKECYDMYQTDKIELLDNQEFITIPMTSILKKFTTIPDYKPGLRLQAVLNFYNTWDELFISFRSIPYMLTPDAYSRYLCDATDDNFSQPDKSEIDSILENMEITQPKIYNKTIQNVIAIDNVNDSKSHIIQPVFFRTRPLTNCTFHPEVTENICINLDSYKSQVTSFFLKIEGVIFPEIARTSSGVIFKIQGSLLEGSISEGTYYILNQDSELVTDGKYTYEF